MANDLYKRVKTFEHEWLVTDSPPRIASFASQSATHERRVDNKRLLKSLAGEETSQGLNDGAWMVRACVSQTSAGGGFLKGFIYVKKAIRTRDGDPLSSKAMSYLIHQIVLPPSGPRAIPSSDNDKRRGPARIWKSLSINEEQLATSMQRLADGGGLGAVPMEIATLLYIFQFSSTLPIASATR
ncbi:uncharacterized protein EI97DRAFT_443861 [Westerdykella ornata]|uniref:Uncharacterized protein n=1 Tax=Westerdykella ornata TaxID=318751 RepID=A0A6A6JEG2_WESOR|nr:uncharacterized protein EI97DRAFT_443861 [Westerdykella ornata]KAF2274677.1 hypothetical protein EI97DRAFT_443861 [Westerdykella ornata]